MTDGSVVAFDGSWSHRRGAKECVVVLVDSRTRRIVDFEIVTKANGFVPGNYDGSSNGMEIAGLKVIIERWKKDTRVIGCVHDNDSKATKAIRDAGWNIEQYYDPNHVSKSFKRTWDNTGHDLLKGIGAKLLRWFQYLIRSNFSPEERTRHWMNVLEHFKGNHTNCPFDHPTGGHWPGMANPAAAAQLKAFLKTTLSLVTRTYNRFDSQMCESFNAVKLKFASKKISWKVSWPIRVMCAVMQANSDEDWRLPLAERCHLRLSEEAIASIQKRHRRAMDLNAMRRTLEYRRVVGLYRSASHVAARRNQAGASDYHLPHRERGTGRLEQEPDPGEADFELIPYADAAARDPTPAEFDRAPIEDTQPNPELMPADERPFGGLFVIPMIPFPRQTRPSQPREFESFRPPSELLSLPHEPPAEEVTMLPFISVEKRPTVDQLIPYADAVAREPTLSEFDSAPIEDTQANPDWKPCGDQPFCQVLVMPMIGVPGQTHSPQPGELGYVEPPCEKLSCSDQMAPDKLDEPPVEWTVSKTCCVPVEEEPTDEELRQEELEEEADEPLDQHERDGIGRCHTDEENVLVIDLRGN
jgi:hypothetical protein